LVEKLNIEAFLESAAGHPLIDVRSPSEYNHAHIPGAINLPLFSDEERSEIGTTYKQQGREAAMMEGLTHYGKNMQRIVSDLKEQTSDKHLFIHCWRGGMRSGVVSWMLDLFGYKVTVLNGGYKSFRQTVLQSFDQAKNLVVLGGKTGSAKTEILHALSNAGEQIADLEKLAHHKGSAFGDLGEMAAPTQEQFENDLFDTFRKLDPASPIWVEDESQRIGLVNIPNGFWKQMREGQVLYLDIPFEARLKYIVSTYGKFDIAKLAAATKRIQKKLGGLETSHCLNYLEAGDFTNAFSILLKYYDKHYERATATRSSEKIEKLSFENINDPTTVNTLLEHSRKLLV
jgi:tRNA 2-selenouridine synthase